MDHWGEVTKVETTRGLVKRLRMADVVAIDTETTDCDPNKESPVGRAKLWCVTFAWRDKLSAGNEISRAFVSTEDICPELVAWLEDPKALKVGTNLLGYDRHVFANHGIHLRGVLGDTLGMSRLLNPSKLERHGLKAWGEKLGFETVAFSSLAGVPWKGKQRCYKLDRVKDGVSYTAGALFNDVDFSRQQQLSLTELWQHYPAKRQEIVHYATQDAEMSLVVYEHLQKQLQQRGW